MLAYFVHNIDPYFIHFPDTWPINGIRWYGIAYLFAFLIGEWLLKIFYKQGRIKINTDKIQSLFLHVFLGVLVGGRVGYIFLYWNDIYKQYPLDIFKFWQGGMASHGGFIGVFICVIIWSKRNNYSVLSVCDLILAPCAFGIFLGRCANFINGELYGNITTFSIGVMFKDEKFYRHPSQLYEATGEGLLLFILCMYCIKNKKLIKCKGVLSSYFLMFYSIIRFLLEYFRVPDASLILNMSRGQFYSVIFLIIGIMLNIYIFYHKKAKDLSENIFNI